MAKLTLKIIGPVPLGGKRPGEQFSVACDDEGAPIDIYWRKRLKDEVLYQCGAVAIVASPVAAVPPPAAPIPPDDQPPADVPQSASPATTKSRKA